MRTSTLLNRCAALALMVGSVTAASVASADGNFEALLADVNFGQSQEPAQPFALPATELSSLPTPDAKSIPVPAAQQNVNQSVGHHLAAETCDGNCGGACDGGCGSASAAGCQSGSCGSSGSSCLDGYCQPYVQPQLPHSTLYQYWRSSACFSNVWDGYRNRCAKTIDLSIHNKGLFNCKRGQCDGVYPAGVVSDCGPAPQSWFSHEEAPCDACDSQ